MATQQFGYGPNVWAPAKGIGVQQFAKLQQPGAVAPQFKAENKYKALAAKAIGEMAYGAMMNSQAKKKKAEERALTQSLYGDTFEALSGEAGNFMFQPFESSVVPTEKDKTNTETKSTETTVNFDATNYNKGVAPTHVPVDKKVDVRTSGRYMNLKVTMNGTTNPELSKLQFDIKMMGVR